MTICIFVNFFDLTYGLQLMLAILINFSPSNRNPNKEAGKLSKFLYLLNLGNKLQSILDFDEITVVRFSDVGIGMTQIR